MSETIRPVRRYVREHGSVLAGVDACADTVARSWDDDRPTDGVELRSRLRAELERADLLEPLAVVLAGAVDAAEFELPARPVPAPPYVVVTSRGPILRATVEPGRLVIRLDAFDVDRDGAYRRLDDVDVTVSLN